MIGELPGVPPAFIERALVEEVAAVFAGGGRVAVVYALTGGRGVGKTQVAAAFARAEAARGCPLVAWVSAEDRDRLISGLAAVAAELGVADPDGDSERSATRLRELLQVRTEPAVLIFDNAVDPVLVRSFVPATGAVRIVITSTDQSFTSMGQAVDVAVFARPESLAYLQRRTGLADLAGADELAAELGDLPLALAQAASVMRSRGLTFGRYVQLLRQQPVDALLPPDKGGGDPRGTSAALMLSLDTASAQAGPEHVDELLSLIALLNPDGINRNLVAQLLNRPDDADVEATLEGLVGMSVLTWAHGSESVVMHRLIGRIIRDRDEKAGRLEPRLTAAVNAMSALLVPDDEARAQRPPGAELVPNALAVWNIAVTAAERGAVTPAAVERAGSLALWVVRHLQDTADLSRAITVGSTVLADSAQVLGHDHPDTLAFRHALAVTYWTAGDLDRAIPLYEQTLTDTARVLGHDHPDTLTSRNNLAVAYHTAGDLGRAIPLHEQTLTDRQRVLGRDHPDTLTSLNNLAYAYEMTGNLGRAMATPLYEQILTDSERVLGRDHPDTLTARHNLAEVYQATGDLGRAIPLYKQNLTDRQRVLGRYHPDTMTSRNNLGAAYRAKGDLRRAMPLYRQTLTDSERALGHDHPDTLSSRNNLAGAYWTRGDLDRAISLYEQNLTDAVRALGEDHPRTQTFRKNLETARHHRANPPPVTAVRWRRIRPLR